MCAEATTAYVVPADSSTCCATSGSTLPSSLADSGPFSASAATTAAEPFSSHASGSATPVAVRSLICRRRSTATRSRVVEACIARAMGTEVTHNVRRMP